MIAAALSLFLMLTPPPPTGVPEMRVPVDGQAVERGQPVSERQQLGIVQQRAHLVEPIAGREFAFVRRERVVDLAQGSGRRHRIGARRIVVDVRPERDEQAVALVRPWVDVARPGLWRAAGPDTGHAAQRRDAPGSAIRVIGGRLRHSAERVVEALTDFDVGVDAAVSHGQPRF